MKASGTNTAISTIASMAVAAPPTKMAVKLLSAGVPGQSGADVAAELTSQDGVPVLRVTVSSSLPGLGFLPGPIPVEVSGHAFRQ